MHLLFIYLFFTHIYLFYLLFIYLFIICLLFVYYLFIVYLLFIYYLFIIYLLFIYLLLPGEILVIEFRINVFKINTLNTVCYKRKTHHCVTLCFNNYCTLVTCYLF